MAKFSTKVQVNKPVEHTFDRFLDEQTMAHWITGFKGIEILRGEPREPDSLYRMMIHFNGEDLLIYQKLIEVHPNEKLLVEMEHPEFVTWSEILFYQTGFATQIECTSKIQGKTFRVKLALPLVKNILESRNEKDYQVFKKIIEKNKD